MHTRHLAWEGCFNARDLGGLPAAGGTWTRRGALVRSDALDRLTAPGWDALAAHGVRTILDLRNDDERRDDVSPRPPGLTTIHLPLDGVEDRAFWDEWDSGPGFGTPLYYRPHLERFPARSVGVLEAIARAPEGGVVFHCQGGRDRTGLVTMLILILAGVAHDVIADDYALSEARLSVAYAARGEPDQGPELAAYLAELGTTAREVLLSTLRNLEASAYLARAGLREGDRDALRARLVG